MSDDSEEPEDRSSDGTATEPNSNDEASGGEMPVNLGPCHYDPEESATLLGVKEGQGWISLCDAHRDQASEEGYEIREPQTPLVTASEGHEAAGGDDDDDPQAGDDEG